MLSEKFLEILDCLGAGLHFARLNGGEREKERECRVVKRKSQSPVLDLAQMAGQIKFSSDIPRFWPDKKILNFPVFRRGKLIVYPCLNYHTHAATCISYIIK